MPLDLDMSVQPHAAYFVSAHLIIIASSGGDGKIRACGKGSYGRLGLGNKHKCRS